MRQLVLAALLLLCLPALAQRLEPLPPEQAFQHRASMENGSAVIVYNMPEGIYLYQDRIQLTTATPGFNVGKTILPAGTPHEDEFFGKTTVYYHSVTLRAPIGGNGEFELVSYIQGCDEQIGICYPPLQNVALLNATSDQTSRTTGAQNGDQADRYAKDEAGYLSDGIADNSIFWTIAIFFLLGICLSFTPCVLPMIPVLLGVIGGGRNRRSILLLTAAYISGVTLAFTGFGVLAALSGQLLAATLQQPWLLSGVAILFILLAASSFGAYELTLPAAVQRRLAGIGGGGRGGGAFIMGIISAVVVSPCVAAPLIGALLYIGKSGDVVTGAAALFSLALGMSVLLAAAGIAGSQILPHAGAWMQRVKQLFGILLLFAAVWVASPLLPAPLQLLLYGGLLLFTAVLLKPENTTASVTNRLAQALALAAFLWGAVMLFAAAAGSRDVLTPLSPFISGDGSQQPEAVRFEPVDTLPHLQQRVTTAGKPVMLEFYADWCISCKEFERFTLRDERVIARLSHTLLLRADVTANTAAHQDLLAHFNLYGPPAILFFTAAGEQISDVRVIGYENADTFLETLAAAGL